MAATTRKTTSRKAAPSKTQEENATPLAEVDLNDVPGLSEENDTEESAENDNENPENPENPEETEEISPLDEEMDNLPHVTNPAVNGLLPVIAEQVVRNCSAQATILRNTLSPDGIQHFAKTDSDEELVKGRNEIAQREKDIEKLKAQISALEEANKNSQGILFKRAESLMSKQLDTEEKEAAEIARDDSRKQISNLMSVIKTTLMPEWQQVSDLSEYLASVNRRVHGGQTQISTGSRTNQANRRQWTARAREWAIKVGYDVSDRGRLPEDVRKSYVASNPTDPEPEA